MQIKSNRGDFLKKAILYVHGKGGSYLEAEQYYFSQK